MMPVRALPVDAVEPTRDLSDPARALLYLSEALAEDDPACLAYALTAVARDAGIMVLAVYPAGPNENAPSGAFLGLPGQLHPDVAKGAGPVYSGSFAQRDDVVDFRVQFGATLR